MRRCTVVASTPVLVLCIVLSSVSCSTKRTAALDKPTLTAVDVALSESVLENIQSALSDENSRTAANGCRAKHIDIRPIPESVPGILALRVTNIVSVSLLDDRRVMVLYLFEAEQKQAYMFEIRLTNDTCTTFEGDAAVQ
jgi:hypothetical protein